MRRAGHAVVVLAAALAAPVSALAVMPPYVYEAARRDAPNVVVVAVEKVVIPRKGFGDCAVSGTVRMVERGTAYQPGQAVTLQVPCATVSATPPISGTIWHPAETLRDSPFGRAYLDAKGAVALSQYQQLSTLPGETPNSGHAPAAGQK